MIDYCLPLVLDSTEAVRNSIKAEADNYRYFEVWLDYIGDADKTFVSELSAAYPGRVIFLFRRLKLEKPKMDAAKRSELLKSISGCDCLVDLDVNDQASELSAFAKDRGTSSLICSYHNYNETPSDLDKIVSEASAHIPDIIKVASYCNEESDALRLLQLLVKLRGLQKKAIVLGMGDKGTITRIFGTLWGNEMLFAPANSGAATAPGQWTKDNYEKLFKLLK